MMLVRTYLAPSHIHGIGLFAAEDIPAGTLLWRFWPGLDFEYDQAFIDSLPALARAKVLAYCSRDEGDRGYLFCGDDARFWNHADEPNTVDGYLPGTEEWAVYAARDIPAGEELTCDYREFDQEARERGI
jgi:hypothetical protein